MMKNKSQFRSGRRAKRFEHQQQGPLQNASPPGSPELASAFSHAVALHQAGRLAEAEKIYRQLLKAQPRHFDSLHLLGVIYHQRGNHAEAVRQIDVALKINSNVAAAYCNRAVALQELMRFDAALASCDKAIALKPDYAEAFYNRGIALKKLQRLGEALASYDKALALKPDFAEALNNRGIALKELKQFSQALVSYDQAIVLKPDYAEPHLNRGVVLQELKRRDEALASFDKALALKPEYAEAYLNRGVALQELKRLDEALASYDKALALMPDYAETWNNRGNALKKLKQLDEALASYDKALALKPDYAEALNNRGNVLQELNQLDEALASYDEALALKPDYVEAFTNRGVTLQELQRFDEALASYDKALALKPEYAEALYNRGITLQELRRLDEALASYDKALSVRPDFAEVHWNEALLRLLIGDFSRGWAKYEWRWQVDESTLLQRTFAQPLWLGTDAIAGKTILLHSEQGLGDTIQFCRFTKLLAQRGAKILLQVQPELRSLMLSVDGPASVIAHGDEISPFDYHIPLMSLPLAFKTTLDDIPNLIPYLYAPKDKIKFWYDRLGTCEKPKVGLVWAGNPRKWLPNANRIDRQRSLHFNQLTPLLESTECQFFSLQKGDEAIEQLRHSPLRGRVIDWTAELHDFADTAALIENLDLVIAVDTSVPHLAGALGKPFWLINRYNTCWRWLLDREDSPWYPTARIFRQPIYGEWTSVIDRIASELQIWSSGDGQSKDCKLPRMYAG